jgi:hypothetical protein
MDEPNRRTVFGIANSHKQLSQVVQFILTARNAKAETVALHSGLVQRLFTSSADFGLMCGYLLAYRDQGHLYECNSSKGFSGNRRSRPACR